MDTNPPPKNPTESIGSNPFLIDIEEKDDYTLEDYQNIQTQLYKKNIDAELMRLYAPQNNFYSQEDFRNRISRGITQTIIDHSRLPTKTLYKIGNGGDGKQCFVCCVPFSHTIQDTKNNSRFLISQQILKSLETSGFQGYFYLFTGGFPNPTGTEMKYVGVPYAFKIFMMLEAEKKGFTKVIWIDSGCYALNNPEALFDTLNTESILAQTVHSNNWKAMVLPQTIELLNHLTNTDLEDAVYIQTIVFGLNLETPAIKRIIQEYYEMVKLGWPFFSIFPEEVVLSAIINKPDYKHLLTSHPVNRFLQIHEKHKTELQARSEGFYFHHKDYSKYKNSIKHYKFVILIIDSDGQPCYEQNRQILRKYVHSVPTIYTLFLRANPDQLEEVVLKDDTLYCKRKESFVPGILEKTLDAMNYCIHHYSFDYMIRTNLSSFWNFNELLKLGETLPQTKCVSASIVTYAEKKAALHPYFNKPFPSGAGILISRDIVELFCASRSEFDKDLPDDVALGQFLFNRDIPVLPAKRFDLIKNTVSITKESIQSTVNQDTHFHYRVKGVDRQYDNRIFQYLYNAIYKRNLFKSTLVTFYFNLSILPDTTSEVRPESFYMEKGVETLKIFNPLVIFCDETTYPIIKTIRDKEVSDPDLTQYIIKPFTEYDFYKDNYPIIRKNREGVHCYTTDRITSSYFLATVFKIFALNIAHQKNFFSTPFYTWIDFGGSHVLREFGSGLQRILNNPLPKISLCYIHYRGHDELNNRIIHKIQGGYCGIAAGSITIEANYISRFYTGCISIFYEMLFHGVGHAEEQIINYFYDRYPDLCNIYYGDYYSILTNYHHPVQDYSTIKHYFIEEALKKGRADLARTCAYSILMCVNKGLLNLDRREVNYLQQLCPE